MLQEILTNILNLHKPHLFPYKIKLSLCFYLEMVVSTIYLFEHLMNVNNFFLTGASLYGRTQLMQGWNGC